MVRMLNRYNRCRPMAQAFHRDDGIADGERRSKIAGCGSVRRKMVPIPPDTSRRGSSGPLLIERATCRS